jgi:Na+-transporting methylmalonyl-CoA/oxaloacetate decarboxylase gamma subunit
VVAQLVFILQGFGLVVAVLALLWLLSALLGRIFGARATPAAVPSSGSVERAQPPPAVSAGVPPAHVAVIAAAVAVATSGRGRVVRVVAPAHGAAGWVGAGRAQHAQEHRTRQGWSAARLGTPHGTSSHAVPEDLRS